ncbi:MAG: DUF1134 domain-containing protein [Pseudomonadota bacterium]
MTQISQRLTQFAIAMLGSLALVTSPVFAQSVESFDPDEGYSDVQVEGSSGAIDADLADPSVSRTPAASTTQPGVPVPYPSVATQPVESRSTSPAFDEEFASYSSQSEGTPEWNYPGDPTNGEVIGEVADSSTYGEDDLIGAAEGVFGKGAEGLAKLIQDLLKDQGEPNGYIIGREAGGAFIVGARYGSGTLHHKIEGERKVYWTGPSIGLDAGANAANTFVLVYNLYDTEDLYERYPAGEGQAYFVGGLNASYMRRGDVVLIPIRVGAGLRLGINAGYMKFSKKQRWLPF